MAKSIDVIKQCVDEIESKADEGPSAEDLSQLKRCIEWCFKMFGILDLLRTSFVEYGMPQEIIGTLDRMYSDASDLVDRGCKIMKKNEARKRESVGTNEAEHLTPIVE